MTNGRTPVAALEHGYPARAERWIATGRAVLATVPPVVWWLGAYEATVHQRVVHVLLWGYVAYAWLLAALISEMPATRRWLQVSTHLVDLVMYGVFIFLFQGQGSPFSFYFAFAVVAAGIRWEWRGTLWTAAVGLTLYVGVSLYFSTRSAVPFELYRWFLRVAFLAVVAALVGLLGAYEAEWRREVSRLAIWSPRLAAARGEALAGTLGHAAEILKAGRVVLVWEDEEDPTVEVIFWTQHSLERFRESPQMTQGLVAPPLEEASFFCNDVAARPAVVWHTCAGGVRRWDGAPVRTDVVERFGIRQLLAIRLQDELVSGYLFALDKPRMTVDDLLLGRIVARELVAQLEHFVLTGRLHRAAVNEERLRLAGDLHDGLLQSLAAAALHIEVARAKLRSDPDAARSNLDKVDGLLRGEQHDLRFLIDALRPQPRQRRSFDTSLGARLRDFAETVQKVWQVGVAVDSDGLDDGLAINGQHEVYRIVQEAVINAARHASASSVRVGVRRDVETIRVAVADNGHGFPFHGHLDHAALTAQNLGPVSLRQRVTRLGGTIAVTSNPSGAQVDIALPRRALES